MNNELFQKQVLRKLEIMERAIGEIKEHIEDSRLNKEEIKQIKKAIEKLNTGDTSEFVSWKQLKKEMGV